MTVQILSANAVGRPLSNSIIIVDHGAPGVQKTL